jgi:hypothetical protein
MSIEFDEFWSAKNDLNKFKTLFAKATKESKEV